jgi:GNAT superfamily N-acetyltransferase
MGAPVTEFRILKPGDEAALGEFLLRYAASSMFLRSNCRAAGLADHGERYQGTYAAAFDGGAMVAVAGHFWNGNIILQAPDHLADVLDLAVSRSGRDVRGIVGPWEQADAALAHLKLDRALATMMSREVLMSLGLERLVVPEILGRCELQCRPAREAEIGWLAECRRDYCIEVMGQRDTPDLFEDCLENIRATYKGWWVLEDGGAIVACSTFNAALSDMVQVGGVFTPPALRRRGYGRAVVAGSLMASRDDGVATATLFTEEDNPPAQHAYRALGFEEIGDYGLMLW